MPLSAGPWRSCGKPTWKSTSAASPGTFWQEKITKGGPKYSSLAGRKAQQKGAYGEAVAYLKMRALSLERLPRSDETGEAAD